jgi:hypothetical protein
MESNLQGYVYKESGYEYRVHQAKNTSRMLEIATVNYSSIGEAKTILFPSSRFDHLELNFTWERNMSHENYKI